MTTSSVNADQVVREQLSALLQGGNAHLDFDRAVADFPLDQINVRGPEVPYTFWHLLEHLRIAQWDILEFIRNPEHRSPTWPKGYWPEPDALANAEQWRSTIEQFRDGLHILQSLATDPDTNLYVDLPHAAGYTILREILVVADHNAYHIGEFAILRQVMDNWAPAKHE